MPYLKIMWNYTKKSCLTGENYHEKRYYSNK